MKLKLCLLILFVSYLYSCGGGSPASDPGTQSTPAPLESIVLNSTNETLVLKDTQSGASNAPSRISIAQRCDELGRLEGVQYSKVETRGKNGVNLNPCFKNVHYWKEGMIYGQYRPDINEAYVSFLTDVDGNVHHLPDHPKKRLGFKNVKMIDRYNGKPLYLNPNGHVVTFNMETDEEETVINTPVGHFVVLNKNNGDHIAYHDLAGGKIRRPDGSIEDAKEISNSYNFYYKNGSNDLTYMTSLFGFKNMIFDENGVILDRIASVIPVALQDFYDNFVVGDLLPKAPSAGTGIQECERSDNMLICYGSYNFNALKGYLIASSDQDLKEVKWFEYGVLSAATREPKLCLTQDFIYVYSEGESGQVIDGVTTTILHRRLTQINRDLSDSAHILTNIEIERLSCMENGKLLISGLNMDTSLNEVFHFDPEFKIKTMITESIREFIQ